MAAKVSTELKNEVKALREVCKVFIDLRKATEESLLAYIAENKPKKIETASEVEETTPTLSDFEGIDSDTMQQAIWYAATPLSCDVCGFQACPLPLPLVDDYWEKWNATYSRAATNLRLNAKPSPIVEVRTTNAALIGVVVAIAVIELFKLAVMAFELTKKEVVKRRLIERGFSAAAHIANQFKSRVKARGFAIQG